MKTGHKYRSKLKIVVKSGTEFDYSEGTADFPYPHVFTRVKIANHIDGNYSYTPIIIPIDRTDDWLFQEVSKISKKDRLLKRALTGLKNLSAIKCSLDENIISDIEGELQSEGIKYYEEI